MTQHGIVLDKVGALTRVSVAKTSMCGENCASCSGGCRPSYQTVYAINNSGETLSKGDTVALEMEAKKVLGGAALLYLVPLAALFVAYFITASFTDSEAVCACIALAAVIVTVLVTRLLDKHLQKKGGFSVSITKRLHASKVKR